jgi:hypothetical protein
MQSERGALSGLGSGTDDTASLPVEDFELGLRGIGSRDEDRLRAKSAVDDAAALSVAEGIGDLADKIDPDMEGDLAVRLSEVMVQANLVGFTAKQNCRAEFVFGVALGLEDVFVAERTQDVILALGHFVDEPRIDGRLSGNDVDANPAGVVLQRDVLGVPVLKGIVGAFGKEFLEFVVTDAAMALTRPDAGLIERPCEPGNDGAIDEGDILFEPGGVAELQSGDDAGGVVAVALADADAIRLGKMVVEVGIGQEDQRFEIRQAFGTAGGLPFE